eukprot:TRINITY_DN71408_c0_g1_i1.p1 TRINITY_DN71408_c0_g1~~TRINITY_DN71408_c0_g1_i1.p1  ORF type:complete len:280 (-),score=36.90 TRINITY_DN71408_c0_g1_i1:107-892(-)
MVSLGELRVAGLPLVESSSTIFRLPWEAAFGARSTGCNAPSVPQETEPERADVSTGSHRQATEVAAVVAVRAEPSPLPLGWPPLAPEEHGHGSPAVTVRIASSFTAAGVDFEHLGPHDVCRTSEDAVRIRQANGWTDTTLSSGAKAMLLMSKDQGAALIVLSATGRLNWKRARAVLPGTKKSDWRMATEDEVASVTGGCVPGSVPPCGSCFLPGAVPTYADEGLREMGVVNFNCGLRTRSIRVSLDGYIAAENPQFGQFVE